MSFNLKKLLNNFLNNDKDYPLFCGFISGFYPFLFLYSNNFEILNSYKHLFFFIFLFIIIPIIITILGYCFLAKSNRFKVFKRQYLFVTILCIAFFLMSFVFFNYVIKKKIIVAVFLLIFLISFKLQNHYKKIVVLLILLTIFPIITLTTIIYRNIFKDTLVWTKHIDAIEDVKFVKKPNIYFIEPDGYAGQESMKNKPYSYNSDIYNWLSNHKFKIYDSYSNYPASLASNASMFTMKHHFLKHIPNSNFEMENARSIIVGNNSTIKILKKNNYKTYFIVEDDYFQQNLTPGKYDYYNIESSKISLITDGNSNKRDVFKDFKKCFISDKKVKKPKFYFIEKLLPHHIHFDKTGKENERRVYLNKVNETNIWLKKIVNFIEINDPNGIIIIAADHGGWVGIESLNEMFTTNDLSLQKSIFNNLLAIKWNDSLSSDYDDNLNSNVNIFRVLFSNLSQDKKLLNHLEPDTSYRITKNGFFSKKATETSFTKNKKK